VNLSDPAAASRGSVCRSSSQYHPMAEATALPAISVAIREPTEDAMSANPKGNWNKTDRRDFIGGSDARIIMGQDEKASIRVRRRVKTRING
jgi:hypothetical protein